VIEVVPGDPNDPSATRLLEGSRDLMRALFNPEDNHFLSTDALCQPHVRFLIAKDGTQTLGCGAVALMDGYGEIKSMFTDPNARRRGVAAALLTQLEAEARSEGMAVLRLETGDLLTEARALYGRHGFVERGPFGDYPLDGAHSVFMEKRLD